jgi:hypothetical protein
MLNAAGAADLHCNATENKATSGGGVRKKSFSIYGGVVKLGSTRFSLPEDVVRFWDLIHLIVDQSSSLGGERSK